MSDPKVNINLPKELIDVMNENPKLAKMVVQKLSGGKSINPYYTEQCAFAVMPIINVMLKDTNKEKSIEILHSDYPKWTAGTIRQKLYAGIQYALDHMDPEGSLRKWWSSVRIEAFKDRPDGSYIGFRIYWIDVANESMQFIPRIASSSDAKRASADKVDKASGLVDEKESTNWREDLVNVIENLPEGSKTKLRLNRLLNDEDKQEAAGYFTDLPDFTVIIYAHEIVVVRKIIPDVERIQIL
jgi:hypothetical protein